MKQFVSLVAVAAIGMAAVACGSGTEGQQDEFTPIVQQSIVVPTIPRGLPSTEPSQPFQRVESDLGYVIDIPSGWFDRGVLQGLSDTSGDRGRFYTSTGGPGAQDTLTVTCRAFETTPAAYANADADIAVNLGAVLGRTEARQIAGREAHVIEYSIGAGTVLIEHRTGYIQTDECTWRIDLSAVTDTLNWDEVFEHIISSFDVLPAA